MVTFKAVDYAFNVPATVPAGLVDIHLDNQGTEPHQITLARLADGQDPDAVLAGLDNDDLSFMALATLVGGPDDVPSGQDHSVTTILDPGTYVAFCAIQSPTDGKAHFMKGMRASFTVAGASGAGSAAAPSTDGTITIGASGYALPAGFSGHGTFAVDNAMPLPADLSILRLADGKGQQDVVDFLSGTTPPGPPPFVAAGGVTTISHGTTAYLPLDLDPGTYVFLAFTPDPQAGFAPLFTSGVISTVTVP